MDLAISKSLATLTSAGWCKGGGSSDNGRTESRDNEYDHFSRSLLLEEQRKGAIARRGCVVLRDLRVFKFGFWVWGILFPFAVFF